MIDRPGGHIPFAALGLLEAAALAAIGWLPGARETPLPALALWATGFLAYAAAGLRLGRSVPSPTTVWGVGIGMRVALLPLSPHFSEDIYRYMWDGHVQTAGVNPYLYAPADPELAGLRTAWHSLVNHPEIPTVYPPAAQIVFVTLTLVGPSLVLFKLAFLACDLGVAWAVGRLADRRADNARGSAAGALLLYLWCPLLVLEVAWSGHLEPLGLLPMMAALLFLTKGPGEDTNGARPGRARWAGALLGLGAGVKLAPAAGLPALWRRRGAIAATFGLGVLLLLYLPYLTAGERLFAGLGTYADRWEFNPGLWWALSELAGPGRPARGLAALLVAGVALGAVARRWPVEKALFWTFGAGLLLSPTLHPWYVLWILPFAALRASQPWLLFTGLVFLAYWGRSAYLSTGVWPRPTAVALLIHLPLLILLSLGLRPSLRLRGGATHRWWPRSRRRRGR